MEFDVYLESWMIPILCLIFGALIMSGVMLVFFKNKKVAFILSLISSGLMIALLVLGLIFGEPAPKEEKIPGFFDGLFSSQNIDRGSRCI